MTQSEMRSKPHQWVPAPKQKDTCQCGLPWYDMIHIAEQAHEPMHVDQMERAE